VRFVHSFANQKKFWPGSGRVNFLWLGLGQPFMVWVWISKISPKNIKFFNFFPLDQKKSLRVRSESTRVEAWSASYLLRVKSKLGSGQGPSLGNNDILSLNLDRLTRKSAYLKTLNQFKSLTLALKGGLKYKGNFSKFKNSQWIKATLKRINELRSSKSL